VPTIIIQISRNLSRIIDQFCSQIIMPGVVWKEAAIMKAEWLFDARKIPDEVMNYIRRIAVNAVTEKHSSPELVAQILGISRSSIYSADN